MPTSYEVLGLRHVLRVPFLSLFRIKVLLIAILSDVVPSMAYWHVARKASLANDSFVLEDYIERLREFIEFLRPVTLGVPIRRSISPALFTISSMARSGKSTRKSGAPTGDQSDVRRGRTVVCEPVFSKQLDSFERGLIDSVQVNPLSEGRSVYPVLVRVAFVETGLSHCVTSHPDFIFCIAVDCTEAADAHRQVYNEFSAVLGRPTECHLKNGCAAFQVVRRTWHVRGEAVRVQAITDIALTSIEVERYLQPGTAPRRTRPRHRPWHRHRYVAHALLRRRLSQSPRYFFETRAGRRDQSTNLQRDPLIRAVRARAA